MKRRTRGAARRRRKDLFGYALLAATALVIGGLAYAASNLRTPEYDPDTLCLSSSAPPAHTLVLVDATDRLDVRHLRRLETIVAEEAARLPRWGRLTLVALDPDGAAAPKRLFSGCTPGDRANANPLWENVRVLEEEKRDKFDGAIASAIRRAKSAQSGDGSPIVEALYAAVADPSFAEGAGKRRLVLVSDLLQNDPGVFSLYEPGPRDFAAYAHAKGAVRTPPDLSAVDVRVAMLERPNRAEAQSAARNVFWPDYFSTAGAHSVAFDR